jgi:hypothetical protein
VIAHGIPIYVALEPVDMRFGYERLGGFVREKMQAAREAGAPKLIVAGSRPAAGIAIEVGGAVVRVTR